MAVARTDDGDLWLGPWSELAQSRWAAAGPHRRHPYFDDPEWLVRRGGECRVLVRRQDAAAAADRGGPAINKSQAAHVTVLPVDRLGHPGRRHRARPLLGGDLAFPHHRGQLSDAKVRMG